MKKQPQVTELTRKKLINSFWNLYKEKDISKIRIKIYVIMQNMIEQPFIDILMI